MRDNASITPESSDSNIFDDLFHGCAFQAYLDEARAVQGWPESEATRRRAYRYYEEALAEQDRRRSTAA
jgi:hypothetical protein